jgi:hypothetical protein
MLPGFAHSLYQNFEREGIPLLLAGGLGALGGLPSWLYAIYKRY